MALDGWSYYATETVTGSSDGTLTNRVIRITIPYQSFMNSNFSDIRFCAPDGSTLLTHNRKSYTANSSATFDVKIPSLPASPDTYTIYVYAGNSAATDVSDPANVYLYQDPATSNNSSNYTLVDILSSGNNATFSYDSTNKYYILTTTANDMVFAKINSLDGLNNFKLEVQLEFLGSVGNLQGGIVVHEVAQTSFAWARYLGQTHLLAVGGGVNGSYSDQDTDSVTLSTNTWYTLVVTLNNQSLSATWYDSNGNVLGTETCTLNGALTGGSHGLLAAYDSGNRVAFKNIKAYAITTNEPTVGSLSSWTQTTSTTAFSYVAPGLVSVIPYGGILIEDLNGIILSEIDFSVQRGFPSPVQQILLNNQSSKDRTVTLTPLASTIQQGAAVETYQAQFLSSDGITYVNSLTVTVPPSSNKTVYTKYSPPDNSVPGPKEWKLGSSQQYNLPFSMPAGWNYVNILPITGSVDGPYSNAVITVTVPFVGTVMNADYSDIRFYTMDGTQLSYQLVSSVGGSGTFKLLIPILPGSPSITKLFIIAGNENATTTSTTVTGNTPTTAPTLGSLGAWNYYGSLECKADVQYNKQEIEGLDYSPSFLVKVGGVEYE